MTARELRQKFLDFFRSKGHTIHPSGSLVPIDVTGRLDESLLFNGAGMVQFKPYFRGVATPPNPRLVTAQKCVRTGDIESVGNLSHLTFFEMLGNFSFGDYFKKDAIAFSWEFLTSKEWLGLDPRRLSFTVFEEDDEAYGYWAEHLRAAGIAPETRVFRLGEETNYWPAGAFSNGPPGPCGPNSEMFYWTSETLEPPPTQMNGSVCPYTVQDWLADDAAKNWLEIWNDVFIQYEWQGELKNPERPNEGYRKTGMPNLPFQSIDTGMGLERTTAVLNGLSSVYDTDLFKPILRKLEEIAATQGSDWKYGSNDEKDRAARIIADHIRTASFCIADGILPSNNGRGYVLRRLIRRAVLKGQRVLGFEELFFYKVFDGVVEAMQQHYLELYEANASIVQALKNEESLFRLTLKRGAFELDFIFHRFSEHENERRRAIEIVMEHKPDPNPPAITELLDKHKLYGGTEILTAQNLGFDYGHWTMSEDYGKLLLPLAKAIRNGGDIDAEVNSLTLKKVLPGKVAFFLYDTFGFPLEVTQELCEEAGVEVDLEGYEAALKEAQERSRQGSGMETVYGGVSVAFVFETDDGRPTPTLFRGYETTSCEATIVGALPVQDEGGRPSGEIALALDQTPFYAESGGQVSDTGTIRGREFELEVIDVTKQDGVFVHICRPSNSTTSVDGLFGQQVRAEVHAQRRRAITRNHTATHLLHAALRNVLGKHVTQAGSLVAPNHLRFDFTHGKALAPEEIREVERQVNEQALAGRIVTIHSDVPIEQAKAMGAMALFGEKYGDRVRVVEIPGDSGQPPASIELCGGIHVRTTGEIGLFKILHESSAASGVRRIEAVTGERAYEWAVLQEQKVREAAERLKSNPNDLLLAIDKTLDALREERRKVEKLRAASADSGAVQSVQIGPVELVIQRAEDLDGKEAGLIADRLADGHPNRVTVVAAVHEGKVTFICKVGPEALKAGVHAGNIVKELAQKVGGGGGGRPDFATAGGRNPAALDEALQGAGSIVHGQLK